MRRWLVRPTGLSRGFTQPQQQQQQQQHQHQHQHHHQQRRHIRNRKPLLSNYPYGVTLSDGSGPVKRTIPVFELPDVVLDLDAVDSPHVRPFDAARDLALQESKWGYDPVVDEVHSDASSLKEDMSNALNRAESSTRTPFSGHRFTDLDVMTVALMPESTHVKDDNDSAAQQRDFTTASRTVEIQAGLDRNGIPGLFGRDATKVIPFMLHRQQLTLAALKDPSKRRHTSDSNDEATLNKSIARCENLALLKRLCSRIDSPNSGIEFSSVSVNLVHARLSEFLQSGEDRATPADILKFVNNLTIKHLAANKELNRSMTLFGLQLAVSLGLLPCILQYLQICLSTACFTNRTEGATLSRYQIGAALLAALQRGEGTARGTRPQIFTLLTGSGSDVLAPQASLFGPVAETHEQEGSQIVELCVTLLGELGALRLLLHHWRQRATQSSVRSDEVDGVFMDSFLRCTQILSGVPADGTGSMNLTAITGSVEQDAALDWQNINVVDALHTRWASKVPRPTLSNLPTSVTPDDIKDALNKPDLRTSMRRFQELTEKAASHKT